MRYGVKWLQYAKWWDAMEIVPARLRGFEGEAKHIVAHKDRYLEVQKATGVMWYHVGVIHTREAGGDFGCYLGNGQSLSRRTTEVPAGRGPFSSFLAGCVDALHFDGLTSVRDWRLEKILYYCEIFNGAGYDIHGDPSPYVWGGTNIQVRGKYTSDHVYARVWDPQPGCAPLLKVIAELDSSVEFVRET